MKAIRVMASALGLVLFAATAATGCGGDDPDATGSVECCKVRAICNYCSCSTAEETAGLQDHKVACVNALAAWEGRGCINCQDSSCLSSCR
jgi:hypothetical protein